MADLSLLGNVVQDVHQLIHGLHSVNICCTRRGRIRVAHVIAQHARNISNDMYWMEDSPPPAMEGLYQDSLIL